MYIHVYQYIYYSYDQLFNVYVNLRVFKDFDGAVLTLLHSERPKLYGVLAVLSAIGIIVTMLLYFLQVLACHVVRRYRSFISSNGGDGGVQEARQNEPMAAPPCSEQIVFLRVPPPPHIGRREN